MREWFKRQPWKGCGVAMPPRVRIPQSPPSKGTIMCYLCFQNNPYAITYPRAIYADKKARAAEIKSLLKDLETNAVCEDGLKAIEKLKEEQYELAKEI